MMGKDRSYPVLNTLDFANQRSSRRESMVREREIIENDIEGLSARFAAHGDSPREEDTYQALDLLEEVEAYLLNSAELAEDGFESESKPNIVVLGTTGAGKSTVATFLFGSGRLVVRHERRYSRSLVADPPLSGVEIRSGAISSTLLPVVNHVRLRYFGAIVVWDMPGSRDTRGSFAELVAHLIYQWLLKNVRHVRFLLVSPPLHERPQELMLQNMINGSLVREDNALVIYTKCAVDFNPASTADLEIDADRRNIQCFALPAPTQNNPDGHDYSFEYLVRKDHILLALGGLRSHQVVYDKPLPDAAKLLLTQITKACVQLVRDKLSTAFLKIYDWKAFRGTFHKINATLEKLQRTDATTLQTMMDVLESLAPTLDECLSSDEGFLRASDYLRTLDTLNGCEQKCNLSEWLSPDVQLALENAKKELVGVRNAVKSYHRTEKRNMLVIRGL